MGSNYQFSTGSDEDAEIPILFVHEIIKLTFSVLKSVDYMSQFL